MLRVFAILDVAIGIRRIQRDRHVKRFFVIDCDLHQGNGTAYVFQSDPDVFTFSMHQENNYPIKQKSDLDIGLADRTGDDVYMGHLQKHVPQIIGDFSPDVVVYLAGADPYEYDQLGGLSLTMDGLKKRDEFVIGEFIERNIPIVILLAGGYAFNTDDTVTIHCNTCRAAYKGWTKISDAKGGQNDQK